jgi:hypothetical protein
MRNYDNTELSNGITYNYCDLLQGTERIILKLAFGSLHHVTFWISCLHRQIDVIWGDTECEVVSITCITVISIVSAPNFITLFMFSCQLLETIRGIDLV